MLEMTVTMESVSIILKTWNAPRHVKLCLENLLKNTSGGVEVIIVDNGSQEKLIDYLMQRAEEDSRIQLIQNERNMGPGFANRQGFQIASNRLVCLIDSDVLVPYGWLGRLVEDMASNPAIKMIAPMKHEESIDYAFSTEKENSRQVWLEIKRRYKDLPPQQQFLKFSQGHSLEQFDQLMRNANPGVTEYISSPPDFLGTSCVLLDGNFIKEIGGVAAPEFRAYGSEDVDLCWRVGEAGGLVAKARSVYVHHFHGSSLEDNRLDRTSALSLANQILYEKWKNRLLQQAVGIALRDNSGLVNYLENHFIFHQLAQKTSFLHDLQHALLIAEIQIDLPEDIIWRPTEA
jgi:GT2 family glycosyltransferase